MVPLLWAVRGAGSPTSFHLSMSAPAYSARYAASVLRAPASVATLRETTSRAPLRRRREGSAPHCSAHHGRSMPDSHPPPPTSDRAIAAPPRASPAAAAPLATPHLREAAAAPSRCPAEEGGGSLGDSADGPRRHHPAPLSSATTVGYPPRASVELPLSPPVRQGACRWPLLRSRPPCPTRRHHPRRLLSDTRPCVLR